MSYLDWERLDEDKRQFAANLSAQAAQRQFENQKTAQEAAQQIANSRTSQQQFGQEFGLKQQGQQFDISQTQRQNQLADIQRAQEQTGAGAFADYFKNQPQDQAPMQGPMPNGQTMQGASIGPNVTPTQAMPKPQMEPMTFDKVAASLIKNPQLANNPMAFAAALERFKPIFEPADKQKAEMFSKQLEAQYAPAETAAGKRTQDAARGLIPAGSSGKLKITDLPDAQSRLAALTFQKSITATPDLQTQFLKAKELNKDSFESDLLPADWKVLATRKGASAFAPLMGMTEAQAKKAMVATTRYEQLIKTTIIPRLRAAFGGRVTNFEVQFMNDIEGKAKMSKAERDALIDQSLDFIGQSEAESRDGLDSLGVEISEPKSRGTKAEAGAASPLNKNDPRVQKALAAGYTEQEIMDHIGAK